MELRNSDHDWGDESLIPQPPTVEYLLESTQALAETQPLEWRHSYGFPVLSPKGDEAMGYRIDFAWLRYPSERLEFDLAPVGIVAAPVKPLEQEDRVVTSFFELGSDHEDEPDTITLYANGQLATTETEASDQFMTLLKISQEAGIEQGSDLIVKLAGLVSPVVELEPITAELQALDLYPQLVALVHSHDVLLTTHRGVEEMEAEAITELGSEVPVTLVEAVSRSGQNTFRQTTEWSYLDLELTFRNGDVREQVSVEKDNLSGTVSIRRYIYDSDGLIIDPQDTPWGAEQYVPSEQELRGWALQLAGLHRAIAAQKAE